MPTKVKSNFFDPKFSVIDNFVFKKLSAFPDEAYDENNEGAVDQELIREQEFGEDFPQEYESYLNEIETRSDKIRQAIPSLEESLRSFQRDLIHLINSGLSGNKKNMSQEEYISTLSSINSYIDGYEISLDESGKIKRKENKGYSLNRELNQLRNQVYEENNKPNPDKNVIKKIKSQIGEIEQEIKNLEKKREEFKSGSINIYRIPGEIISQAKQIHNNLKELTDEIGIIRNYVSDIELINDRFGNPKGERISNYIYRLFDIDLNLITHLSESILDLFSREPVLAYGASEITEIIYLINDILYENPAVYDESPEKSRQGAPDLDPEISEYYGTYAQIYPYMEISQRIADELEESLNFLNQRKKSIRKVSQYNDERFKRHVYRYTNSYDTKVAQFFRKSDSLNNGLIQHINNIKNILVENSSLEEKNPLINDQWTSDFENVVSEINENLDDKFITENDMNYLVEKVGSLFSSINSKLDHINQQEQIKKLEERMWESGQINKTGEGGNLLKDLSTFDSDQIINILEQNNVNISENLPGFDENNPEPPKDTENYNEWVIKKVIHILKTADLLSERQIDAFSEIGNLISGYDEISPGTKEFITSLSKQMRESTNSLKRIINAPVDIQKEMAEFINLVDEYSSQPINDYLSIFNTLLMPGASSPQTKQKVIKPRINIGDPNRWTRQDSERIEDLIKKAKELKDSISKYGKIAFEDGVKTGKVPEGTSEAKFIGQFRANVSRDMLSGYSSEYRDTFQSIQYENFYDEDFIKSSYPKLFNMLSKFSGSIDIIDNYFPSSNNDRFSNLRSVSGYTQRSELIGLLNKAVGSSKYVFDIIRTVPNIKLELERSIKEEKEDIKEGTIEYWERFNKIKKDIMKQKAKEPDGHYLWELESDNSLSVVDAIMSFVKNISDFIEKSPKTLKQKKMSSLIDEFSEVEKEISDEPWFITLAPIKNVKDGVVLLRDAIQKAQIIDESRSYNDNIDIIDSTDKSNSPKQKMLGNYEALYERVSNYDYKEKLEESGLSKKEEETEIEDEEDVDVSTDTTSHGEWGKIKKEREAERRQMLIDMIPFLDDIPVYELKKFIDDHDLPVEYDKNSKSEEIVSDLLKILPLEKSIYDMDRKELEKFILERKLNIDTNGMEESDIRDMVIDQMNIPIEKNEEENKKINTDPVAMMNEFLESFVTENMEIARIFTSDEVKKHAVDKMGGISEFENLLNKNEKVVYLVEEAMKEKNPIKKLQSNLKLIEDVLRLLSNMSNMNYYKNMIIKLGSEEIDKNEKQNIVNEIRKFPAYLDQISVQIRSKLSTPVLFDKLMNLIEEIINNFQTSGNIDKKDVNFIVSIIEDINNKRTGLNTAIISFFESPYVELGSREDKENYLIPQNISNFLSSYDSYLQNPDLRLSEIPNLFRTSDYIQRAAGNIFTPEGYSQAIQEKSPRYQSSLAYQKIFDNFHSFGNMINNSSTFYVQKFEKEFYDNMKMKAEAEKERFEKVYEFNGYQIENDNTDGIVKINVFVTSRILEKKKYGTRQVKEIVDNTEEYNVETFVFNIKDDKLVCDSSNLKSNLKYRNAKVIYKSSIGYYVLYENYFNNPNIKLGKEKLDFQREGIGGSRFIKEVEDPSPDYSTIKAKNKKPIPEEIMNIIFKNIGNAQSPEEALTILEKTKKASPYMRSLINDILSSTYRDNLLNNIIQMSKGYGEIKSEIASIDSKWIKISR